MSDTVEQSPQSTFERIRPSEFGAHRYPATVRGWLFFFLPQLTIFVFLTVCVIAVTRKGETLGYLLPAVPMFAANVLSIRNAVRRFKCS